MMLSGAEIAYKSGSMSRKRYTGYALVKKKKGKTTIRFQFSPFSEKPFFISYSNRVAEFLERLIPDINEEVNGFGLTWDKWQRAILFATSVKFFRDERELNKFADFVLEMNSVDLLYWYDHVARCIDSAERRERAIKAMLILYQFL